MMIPKDSWLVRPFPHNHNRITEFRSKGIVAIGWPGIGDLKDKSREDLKTLLAGEPYNLSGLELGNAYATVDIFLNQMHTGDIVLVPNGDDIFFAEVTSNYHWDSAVDNGSDGYPHQRKVKWLSNVSRQELSKELRSSLKVHRATAKLSKHSCEIIALSQGTPFVPQSISINPLINAIAHDGSADEKAYEVLSQFGNDYENALIASTAVGEFFKKIGLEPLAACWSVLSDTTFRAAAFDIAHIQRKIQC